MEHDLGAHPRDHGRESIGVLVLVLDQVLVVRPAAELRGEIAEAADLGRPRVFAGSGGPLDVVRDAVGRIDVGRRDAALATGRVLDVEVGGLVHQGRRVVSRLPVARNVYRSYSARVSGSSRSRFVRS